MYQADKPALIMFTAFFRIGLFTFGGGYSMLPMLEREIVERLRWATREELLDYFAIGQCAPGLIAVNTAVLVGYNRLGLLGASLAAAGVVMPSFLIITVIAMVLGNFADVPAVIHAFAGIRAAVTALILSAVVKLFKTNVLRGSLRSSLPPLLLCVFAFIIIAVISAPPAIAIAGAAAAGLLLYGKAGDA